MLFIYGFIVTVGAIQLHLNNSIIPNDFNNRDYMHVREVKNYINDVHYIYNTRRRDEILQGLRVIYRRLTYTDVSFYFYDDKTQISFIVGYLLDNDDLICNDKIRRLKRVSSIMGIYGAEFKKWEIF